jgi:hypothetical protein
MITKYKHPAISNIPDIYIAETEADVLTCQERGLPYIIDMDKNILDSIIIHILLKRQLPTLNLGKRVETTEVIYTDPTTAPSSSLGSKEHILKDKAHMSTGQRTFDSGYEEENLATNKVSIEDYIGTNIRLDYDVIAKLGYLPKFFSNIVESISANLETYHYQERYNKKRPEIVGNFSHSGQEKPNLLIVDTSYSIPSGISASIAPLLDTMRHQMNADLIVTSAFTYRWSRWDKLPDADVILDMVGSGNESRMFAQILQEHYCNKPIGNIIVFGDDDTPRTTQEPMSCDMLTALHTCKINKVPGYGQWAKNKAKDIRYEHEWVKYFD